MTDAGSYWWWEGIITITILACTCERMCVRACGCVCMSVNVCPSVCVVVKHIFIYYIISILYNFLKCNGRP